MLKSEWQNILKNRKLLIPILAVLFIPVLYAGMFLWAFWDPYSRLDELPVAIVNEDTGSTVNGEEIQVGDELTNKLLDSKQFAFKELTKKQAEKELDDQNYYMVIEIPKSFSEDAANLMNEDGTKLHVIYRPNEGFNFLSAQIGDSAMERVRGLVNEELVSTYSSEMLAALGEVGNGMETASDGAGQLSDGAKEVENGTTQLRSYLKQLASGAIQLENGNDQLAKGINDATSGSQKLSSGLQQLNDGANQLASGATKASTGASDLSSAVEQYTAGVNQAAAGTKTLSEKNAELGAALSQLADGANSAKGGAVQSSEAASQIAGGIKQLHAQLAPALSQFTAEQQAALEQAFTQLEQGSGQLATGLQSLAGGNEKLATGLSQAAAGSQAMQEGYKKINGGMSQLTASSPKLVQGAQQLSQGNTQLAGGANELANRLNEAKVGGAKLANGLTQLQAGANKLQNGTAELASKTGELSDGTQKLADGTKQLADGSSELSTKLADASSDIKDQTPSDDAAERAAAPVEVEKEAVDHVPNYGTGFTPYFLSLGLFVGALLISIVFPLVEPAIRPKNGWSWAFSKTAVLAVVGVVQSLIAVAILLFGLGLEPEHTGALIGMAILTSFTFLALVQMLVSVLGDSGRFVAIIILILQLTTSAGTFPLELIPRALQPISHFLPMTYSVRGFKTVISSVSMNTVWFDAAILGIFMICALAITFFFFQILFKRRFAHQPAEA